MYVSDILGKYDLNKIFVQKLTNLFNKFLYI